MRIVIHNHPPKRTRDFLSSTEESRYHKLMSMAEGGAWKQTMSAQEKEELEKLKEKKRMSPPPTGRHPLVPARYQHAGNDNKTPAAEMAGWKAGRSGKDRAANPYVGRDAALWDTGWKAHRKWAGRK